MSIYAFRDLSIVIVETSRTAIRAGVGLHEILRAPSVELDARVGLRRTVSRLNGNGIQEGNGSGAEQNGKASAKANDYLVGPKLDEALAAGEDIVVSWPFADGDIKDFTQAEALWKYVLFTQLGLKRTQNESPVLLSIPHGLSRTSCERVCQTFFERFNVAGFCILERPMAQIYAANSLHGLVVDIGQDQTDINAIYDCMIQENCSDTLPIGIIHCERYLGHLLRSNESVMDAFSNLEAPELDEVLVELARYLWKQGHIRCLSGSDLLAEAEDEGVTNIAAVLVAGKEKAVIESGMKKKATAKASAAEQARAKEIEALDLITVEFREKSLTIGKERHKFADPLFDPSLLHGVAGLTKRVSPWGSSSLQDVCGHAVSRASVDARPSIWGSLFVTGDCTNLVKGIAAALQGHLSQYVLGVPDHQNEVQPKYVRASHVPEYFGEYREKGDSLAAFLGSSIVAKIAFNDPHAKNFVSKADYITTGPKAVLEMSPNLL